MDSLAADLRSAARNILRRPGFSALAVLTLAVGISVNTVAFTAVDALLFHAFTFPGVDRLGWVMRAAPDAPYGDLSYADFEALRQRARAFDAIAAEGRQPLAVMSDGRAEQVWALFVTRDYFSLLGARPRAGRLDAMSDGQGDLAAIVSYRFWRARLGGGTIAGRTIVIANRTVSVAAVMPDDFQGPGGLYAPDVWLPLERAAAFGVPAERLTGDERWLTTIGRLAPGATDAQARAELTAVVAHLSHPSASRAGAEARLAFFPMRDGHPELRGLAPFVWTALSVISLVLLVACFNMASLLLARAVERRRDIAIRTALGAGRLRIIRELTIEGLVMAALSGAVALALAASSERLLSAFSLPAPIPQRLHMQIDGRVISFTIVMVIAAGILPSLLPALHATRRNLIGSMRIGGGTGRPSRLRHLFVGAQIAGSTLFLATALLFVRSFDKASRVDLGFDPDHLVAARIEPATYGFDGARAATLAHQLVDRLGTTAGLTVTAVDRAPFAVGYPSTARVSTREHRCAADCRPTTFYAVDGRYFAVMGIPLRAGRTFDAQDVGDGHVVIVNETMAAALWPGRSPLGEPIVVDELTTPATVVGVAGATPTIPGTPAVPLFYRPIREQEFAEGFSLIVRATGTDIAAAAIRDTLHTAAPTMPIAQLTSMRDMLAVPLWPRRTAAGLFTVCGILTLVLATVGLFAVTCFAIRQRTREFGVRVAIGATPGRILAQVLGEGARFILPGAAAGLLLAALAGRLLSRLLFGVSAMDPVSFGSAAAIEIAVALAACALPARDAARVDPMIALRAE